MGNTIARRKIWTSKHRSSVDTSEFRQQYDCETNRLSHHSYEPATRADISSFHANILQSRPEMIHN